MMDDKLKKREWLVVYFYEDSGGSAFGNTMVGSATMTFRDIRAIEDTLKQQLQCKALTITNVQELEAAA